MAQDNKKRIEELKKHLALKDGTDLIKYIDKLGKKSNQVERDKFLEALKRGFEGTGQYGLERAFLDGTIKPEEWIDWRDNLGITVEDMGTVLPPYYGKKDGTLKEKAYIVTMEHTTIFKYKDMFKKRFDVNIVTCKEALEKIAKDKDFQKHATKDMKDKLKKVLKK